MKAGQLERRVYAAIALTLVALIVAGTAAFYSARDSAVQSSLVSHTHEVRRQLQLLLSVHQDLETGSRGYAITGRPEFLEPFDAARAVADRRFQDLAALVQDNPEQTGRLQALNILCRQQLEWAEQIIGLRRDDGPAAAAERIASGQGKRGMDALRGAIAAMDMAETRLLEERADAEQDGHVRLNWALFASTLIGLLTAGFAGIAIHRDFGRMRRAENALRELNETLEQRVDERTAQLGQSEARLQATVENLSEGVVVCGLDGHIVHFNRAAMEMHAFSSRDEYLRMLPEFAATFELSTADASILPVDQWPLARVLRGETLRHLEVGVRSLRDGWRRIFSYGGVLVREAAGNPIMAVLTIDDITERKLTEAAAREHQERYSTLFNTLIEGFCIIEVLFNADGRPIDYRFLEINTAFEAQTGLRNAQGKLMRDIAPDHEEHWFAIYGKIALTGESVRFTNEAKALNRWYDVSAYRVGGQDSRKVAILFNDITAIKRGEERLRAQLEHLHLLDRITRAIAERLDLKSIFQVVVRTLEDSMPIDFGCVCLYDSVANALTVTSVGIKSGALAHELSMDEQCSIGVDTNGLSRAVQGHVVYESDIGESAFPFPLRLARGGLRSVVMAPLKSESRVFGVLLAARQAANGFTSIECEFLRQLSEHVALAAHHAQLYESLQQAYDDLRQTQQVVMQEERLRALGQMASGIAHDINNALSPMSMYAELLLLTEKDLSPSGRSQLETIHRAVGDVARTVARMREFYRKPERQLDLAPVDANQMMEQVLNLTRARWNDMALQLGITIRTVTELAEVPMVLGIESEIREALTNLVFNAVDAMPEGGTLTLRSRIAGPEEGRSVVIEVADTGIGMDEQTRRRCLEPFFTTKGEDGTGLGLAMVFGTVQRHGATLEIDSAPGMGTTIRLVFAVPAVLSAVSESPAEAPKPLARLRLLVVDDDPVVLKSLRDALEADGHFVTTANAGEEGIAKFCATVDTGEIYAAVITDLGMPKVDGRKVAAAVKAASPGTPVILLTGWGQRLVAEDEIPPHVDRVLAKPPKLREIRETLAQLCRPHHSDTKI